MPPRYPHVHTIHTPPQAPHAHTIFTPSRRTHAQPRALPPARPQVEMAPDGTIIKPAASSTHPTGMIFGVSDKKLSRKRISRFIDLPGPKLHSLLDKPKKVRQQSANGCHAAEAGGEGDSLMLPRPFHACPSPRFILPVRNATPHTCKCPYSGGLSFFQGAIHTLQAVPASGAILRQKKDKAGRRCRPSTESWCFPPVPHRRDPHRNTTCRGRQRPLHCVLVFPRPFHTDSSTSTPAQGVGVEVKGAMKSGTAPWRSRIGSAVTLSARHADGLPLTVQVWKWGAVGPAVCSRVGPEGACVRGE
eukprot:25231-Chlamydomonas_euryale.AAC.5